MDPAVVPTPLWCRANRRARLLAALVLTLALAAVLVPPSPAALAQGVGAPTIVGAAVRGEAADYATQTFGDPWDYANPLDLQTDEGPVQNASAIAMSGGILNVSYTATGHFHQIWPGWPGGLRIDRDGPANPVDASRYTRLSFRARSGFQTVGAVSFQTCTEVDAGCTGSVPFVLSGDGWDTISVDLTSGSGSPWAGQIHALAITIGSAGPADFSFDWMRLHAPTEPATVTYANPGPQGQATLYWDADRDPANNHADNPGWGRVAQTDGASGSVTFDVGAYPPGTYSFYTRNGGVASPYSAPLTIDAAPRIVIDNPDITGGEDYATAVLGNPWDFSDPADVVEVTNVVDVRWADGRLHGTNGGPDPGNPYVVLADDGDLRADRYHRLTIRTGYEGPFSLHVGPGGGMHGRISWKLDGEFNVRQTSEVVTYSDRDTYTVVMGDPAPPAPLMEPDLAPQPGWAAGRTTQGLRWDVNEDVGARRWWIDDIRLAADDESFGIFDVQWHDDAHQPGTTVELYADRDAQGFDGARIATGLSQTAGSNTFAWNTSQLPTGEYWIYAVATSPSGVATTRTYASGPVQVRTPPADFVHEPAGLRLAGPDRVATAVELSQESFPDGADAAVVARAGDFPDALAAAPLAAAVQGPVLLNSDDQLHPAVRAELQRLGVQRVIVLGGTAAQSAAVEAELRTLVTTVDRAAGIDRFATAGQVALLAEQAWTQRGIEVGDPLVALGSRFQDALAAATLAGHAHRPLLLTSHDVLPPATAEALAALDAGEVTLVGGTGIITSGLVRQLEQVVGRVNRLAGADHYETTALVAEEAVAVGARRDIVLIASGDAFPDALASGPAAVAQGGVLLLTPRDAVAAWTADFLDKSAISRLRIAGGTAAVSAATAVGLVDAAGM